MRYYVEELEHLKVTRVYVFNEFGTKTTIANFYWVVHGRQGAWQKAVKQYNPRREDA